jgi:hypothetical protein
MNEMRSFTRSAGVATHPRPERIETPSLSLFASTRSRLQPLSHGGFRQKAHPFVWPSRSRLTV